MEEYKAQKDLTQCYNWGMPGKGKKENSSLSCCNCTLKGGGRGTPTQYTTEAPAMQRRCCGGKTRSSPKMVHQESSSLQSTSLCRHSSQHSAYTTP